jgi:hypothetical protein
MALRHRVNRSRWFSRQDPREREERLVRRRPGGESKLRGATGTMELLGRVYGTLAPPGVFARAHGAATVREPGNNPALYTRAQIREARYIG